MIVFFCLMILYPAIKTPAGQQADSVIEEPVITGKCIIPSCPEWVHNTVFYQIYPQSFYDSDGNGIGDLQGIIEKLPYLKWLGINAIWLNPFFESPFRDAGYDISDYQKVARRYGTNEDAKRLFEEAHKLGIRILFDFVVNYTSDQHPWFKGFSEPVPNKYWNWYVGRPTWAPGFNTEYNNFIRGFCDRDIAYCPAFFLHQPKLNHGFLKPDPNQSWQLPVNHPDVIAMQDELIRVLKYWMDMGADGFRADMAGDVNKRFWQRCRAILDKDYPDAFMIAEYSYPISAIAEGFHADFMHWTPQYKDLTGWASKADFDKAFFNKTGKGNITEFLKDYMHHWKGTKAKGYACVPIANHDMSRMRNYGRTQKDLEILFAFLFTSPGVPFIWQGEEIGMKQLNGVQDSIDYSIRTLEGAYGGRAGNRTPMQWGSSANFGFSTAAPKRLYLPMDPSPDAPNVEAQKNDPHSLLNCVRKLIQLKRTEPALAAYAEFVPLYAKKSAYPFVYARANSNEVILVVLNPAGRAVTAEFVFPTAHLKLLAGKKIRITRLNSTLQIEVPGQTYSIYKVK